MNTVTASIDEETKRAHAEIERKAQATRERQLKLGQLTKAITAAEAALTEFESKKSFLQSRRQQLKDQLLQLWPKEPSDLSLQVKSSPLQMVAESYGTVLAIDAALADAPQIKKHLDQQLHVAKQQLADFQRS